MSRNRVRQADAPQSSMRKWLIIGSVLLLSAIVLGLIIRAMSAPKEVPTHNLSGLPAPQNVKAEGNVLHWDSVPNAKGYRVYMGDEKSFFLTSYATDFVVTDLANNTAYDFSVVAVDSNDITSELISNPATVNFMTRPNEFTIVLSTPKVTNDQNSSLMQWDAVPNASSYSISVNGIEVAQLQDTKFDLNELYNGIYQVKVRALSDQTQFADSMWSSPQFFLQENRPLLSPSAQLFGQEMSWSQVPGATSYEISINGNITQKTQLSFGVNDLPDGKYNLSVRAMNGDTYSDWSNSVEKVIGNPGNVEGGGGGDTGGDQGGGGNPGNPGGGGDQGGGGNPGGGGDTGGGSPGNPPPGGGGDNGIVGNIVAPSIIFREAVYWDPINGVTGYDAKVNDTIIENIPDTFLAYEKLGPEPGVRVVQVRSRKGGEVSQWSNIVRPTVNLMEPTASINGNKLTWGAVLGAQSYSVCIDGTMYDNIKDTEYDISGLGNGVHNINVRATTNSPLHLISQFSPALTLSKGQGDAPTTAPLIGYTETSIIGNMWGKERILQWSPVAGATGYDVEVDGSIVLNNSPFLEHRVGNLSAGNHTIRVRATNGSTSTDWSNQVSFDPSVRLDAITANGTPTANNLPTPGAFNVTASSMSWGAVPGADAYIASINGTDYVTTGTSFNYTLKGGGYAYQVRVRAVNNHDKVSQWTNAAMFFL